MLSFEVWKQKYSSVLRSHACNSLILQTEESGISQWNVGTVWKCISAWRTLVGSDTRMAHKYVWVTVTVLLTNLRCENDDIFRPGPSGYHRITLWGVNSKKKRKIIRDYLSTGLRKRGVKSILECFKLPISECTSTYFANLNSSWSSHCISFVCSSNLYSNFLILYVFLSVFFLLKLLIYFCFIKMISHLSPAIYIFILCVISTKKWISDLCWLFDILSLILCI